MLKAFPRLTASVVGASLHGGVTSRTLSIAVSVPDPRKPGEGVALGRGILRDFRWN